MPETVRVREEDFPAVELPEDASPFEKLVYYTLFGYWVKATGKRVPGLMERTAKIEGMRWGIYVVIGLLMVPALHSLGVPTDKIWELIARIIG